MTELLTALRRDGYAMVPAATIWPLQADALAMCAARGRVFLDDCRAEPARFASRKKPFLRSSRLSPDWPLSRTHPLVQLEPALAAIAHAFVGPDVTWFSCAYWVILPTEGPQKYSQMWHRDPEADCVLKAFLHIDEVAETNGPFQYVTGTSTLRDLTLCPPRLYAGQQVMPTERVRTFSVPAMTLVVADTSGIHRGGNILAGHRLQAVWSYVPRTSVNVAGQVRLADA